MEYLMHSLYYLYRKESAGSFLFHRKRLKLAESKSIIYTKNIKHMMAAVAMDLTQEFKFQAWSLSQKAVHSRVEAVSTQGCTVLSSEEQTTEKLKSDHACHQQPEAAFSQPLTWRRGRN